MRTPKLLALLGFVVPAPMMANAACVVPSYHTESGIPSGYTAADAFQGRFDYPSTNGEALPPFLQIDFTQDWKGYLEGALAYAFEGNVETDFKVAQNAVRDWYHALWMHPGDRGREFLRGLTKERGTDPGQLADNLDTRFQTWAIGFYNSFGAQTLGQVWANQCLPDLTNVSFPVGTVTFKLLFNTATDAQLPYLAGSPEWMADIGRGTANRVRSMRLLQVDIAVRDERAVSTGWVFGTLVYQATNPAADPWQKLTPVGLSWGSDPFTAPVRDELKAPDLSTLIESRTNEDLKSVLFGWDTRMELGWGGRLNGPLDNLLSSCQSCHGSAQFPRSDQLGNFPQSAVNESDRVATINRLADYFRDIPAGSIFDPLAVIFRTDYFVLARPLDYSLQLQSSIERMCLAATGHQAPFDTEPVPPMCVEPAPSPVVELTPPLGAAAASVVPSPNANDLSAANQRWLALDAAGIR